jgi:hypothetical protein
LPVFSILLDPLWHGQGNGDAFHFGVCLLVSWWSVFCFPGVSFRKHFWMRLNWSPSAISWGCCTCSLPLSKLADFSVIKFPPQLPCSSMFSCFVFHTPHPLIYLPYSFSFCLTRYQFPASCFLFFISAYFLYRSFYSVIRFYFSFIFLLLSPLFQPIILFLVHSTFTTSAYLFLCFLIYVPRLLVHFSRPICPCWINFPALSLPFLASPSVWNLSFCIYMFLIFIFSGTLSASL